jgi:ABC-type nitrate/sulfonate/bicarbonate transport system substrate-binding protein
MNTATHTHRHTRIRVCTFKGLQNLALYAAQEQGLFAAHKLDVEIAYTTGSKPQLAGLARGEFDLIQTAPDNVVNFDGNPAAFGIEAGTAPRILMVLGGSVGPLSVYAQPTIHSFGDLRGTALGVDNPTSGFALLLRDMLARNGLALERDYTFTVAGGTSTRLDALLDGTVAATILYAPFDVSANEQGFHQLAASTGYYPAYASLATAATATWIEAHSDVLIRYITAIRQALRWLYETENADLVQAIMLNEAALALPATLAKRAYAAFIDPLIGFGAEGKLDEAGLSQVIAIRSRYERGQDRKTADYLDMRCYQQVATHSTQ